MFRAAVHRLGLAYLRRVVSSESSRQTFRRVNERPIEYRFVFDWLTRLHPRTVLDVGTGSSALPALLRTCGFVVTAIDNTTDYWPSGMTNRHWTVEHEDIRQPPTRPPFEVVVCISVLEHIPDPIAAIRGLHARTAPGGHVLLTTPFALAGHPNVYTEPGSYGTGEPYICRQSSPSDLQDWQDAGFSLVAAEYWRLFESNIWSVGPLVRPAVQTDQPSNLACFVLRR